MLSPFSRTADLSFRETAGSKNFCQFSLICFSAAAGSDGAVGLGWALLGFSTEGVGGLLLPPPLWSLHAPMAGPRGRTATAVHADARPGPRPCLLFPRLSSLPRTIWLTTGCRTGSGAPGVFRVSFQKA